MTVKLKNNLSLTMHPKTGGGFISVPENQLGYDVYEINGQSNARGNGAIRPGIDDNYTGLSHVFMWDPVTSSIVPFSLPMPHQDSYPNATNFVVQFARNLPNTRRVVFVGGARGSTGFGIHWNPPNAVNLEALARVKNAMATSPYNRYMGLLWHQGEADSANQNTGYVNAWKNYRTARIAENYGLTADTRIIVGSIHENNAWDVTINGYLQQLATDIPAVRYVDLRDIPVQGDNIHFTSAGLQEMGQRYYNAFVGA